MHFFPTAFLEVLSVRLRIRLLVRLSVCPFLSSSIRLRVRLLVRLSVCPFLSSSIRLRVRLLVRLSVSPFLSSSIRLRVRLLVRLSNFSLNSSLLHINARSLIKKPMLTDYLNNINYKFSVPTVSETWANEINSDNLVIPGYNRMLKNRAERGVGVAIFIDDKLSFKQRPDLNSFANINFECVFIEITDNIKKTELLQQYIYRQSLFLIYL